MRPMVNALRSVEIGVPDTETAERFYTGTWNLAVAARSDSTVYLRGTGAAHHILSLTRTAQPELLAVTFNAASRREVDALAQLVPAHGGAILRAPGGGYGIAHEDLEFDEPWLVVDVRVNEKGAARLPKTSAQFCEPARPTTFLIGVGEHRRWEITLRPGETPQEMETDAAVWRLLARWLSPEDGTLWRRASYRFHALVASRWRERRAFLAGDAAHQQPPFLGQGMCQGIRDVANLTWKLAAVLQGRAGDALLDTYGAERGAHVRRLTTTIKGIGRNICERDEARARQRDADLVAQAGGAIRSVPRQELIPPLETGLLSPAPHAANGTLFPQPRVRHQGRSVLLDEVAGHGVRLMLRADGPADEMSSLAALGRCGARVVRIGAGALEEEHGIAAAWFARHGVCAALVRPDHYVFGVASTPAGIEALVAAFDAACDAR